MRETAIRELKTERNATGRFLGWSWCFVTGVLHQDLKFERQMSLGKK